MYAQRVTIARKGSPGGPLSQHTSGQCSTSGRHATTCTAAARSSLGRRVRTRAQGNDASQPDHVLYFAYGANMNYLTLRRRGVSVASRDPARVVDGRYRVQFKHRGGYATLEIPSKRCHGVPEAQGVLYRLTEDDLKKLADKEGGYVLQKMQVATYDGVPRNAWVFLSGRMSTLEGEVKPTESYMRLLRDGASDNYLDPDYQAWLSSIETVPSTGLGPEYWNTPSKYLAYCYLAFVGMLVFAFIR